MKFLCGIVVLCSVVQLLQGEQTCTVIPDDFETQLRLKRECGYYGIDEEECTSDGCCWKESRFEGIPWCYYEIGTPADCQALGTDRVDCGRDVPDLTPELCENKECCFVPSSIGGSPWCFFPDVVLSDICKDVEDKVDCGEFGMLQSECEEEGCCWKPNNDGEPFCYVPELLVPPAEEPVPAVVLPKLSSPEAAKLMTNFKAMKEIIKMLKKKNGKRN